MQAEPTPSEVIAHRGASAMAPEHTYEAYDLAVAQGADVLELDVRATQDGELLVVHDATLARTAGDVPRVSTLTRADVESLPPRVRPLSLGAVFERYGGSVRLLVELNGVAHQAVDAGLVAAAHARGLAVSAWTVNSPATIDRVLAAGADGLITDVPDVAVAAFAAPAPPSVPQAA